MELLPYLYYHTSVSHSCPLRCHSTQLLLLLLQHKLHHGGMRSAVTAILYGVWVQVYLLKKPANFGPHFLANESETREATQCVRISSVRASQWR